MPLCVMCDTLVPLVFTDCWWQWWISKKPDRIQRNPSFPIHLSSLPTFPQEQRAANDSSSPEPLCAPSATFRRTLSTEAGHLCCGTCGDNPCGIAGSRQFGGSCFEVDVSFREADFVVSGHLPEMFMWQAIRPYGEAIATQHNEPRFMLLLTAGHEALLLKRSGFPRCRRSTAPISHK